MELVGDFANPERKCSGSTLLYLSLKSCLDTFILSYFSSKNLERKLLYEFLKFRSHLMIHICISVHVFFCSGMGVHIVMFLCFVLWHAITLLFIYLALRQVSSLSYNSLICLGWLHFPVAGVMNTHHHAQFSYMGFGAQNSGPLACVTSTLLAKLLIHPFNNLY